MRSGLPWTRRPEFTIDEMGINMASRIGAGTFRNAEAAGNRLAGYNLGFYEIGPFWDEEIQDVIHKLQLQEGTTPRALRIALDRKVDDIKTASHLFLRSFSLFFDFVDFFILEPHSESSDFLLEYENMEAVFDEVINMRICYDVSKPLVIRLPLGLSDEMLAQIVHYSLISRIDAVLVDDLTRLSQVLELVENRIPVIASIDDISKAQELLSEGVSLIEWNGEMPLFLPARALSKVKKAIKKL